MVDGTGSREDESRKCRSHRNDEHRVIGSEFGLLAVPDGGDLVGDLVEQEANAGRQEADEEEFDEAEWGLQDDRPTAIREAITCCRKGGTVSVPGAYSGRGTVPLGALMNKALTVKTGQTHVPRYLEPLLDLIEQGDIDPSFVITHEGSLDDAPDLYEAFNDKEDGCVKAVLRP